MTVTMPDELRAPGRRLEAADESARRLLRPVLADANAWFYGLADGCASCQATGRAGINACRQHAADHERASERNGLWLLLSYEDRPGQPSAALNAGHLRILADALPLAIAVRRARRDSEGAIEDHALVAAYSEMARRS